MTKRALVHLSTVHPRHDTRIYIKQVGTLYRAWGNDVQLVVADGLGCRETAGEPSIFDLGLLPASRSARAFIGTVRALGYFWRTRPRLVHFHDPELIPLGFLLRLLGCLVIYDVHEDVPRQTMAKDWIPVVFRWPVAAVISAMEWAAGKTFAAIVPATPTIAARFPAAKTVLVQNFPIQAELVVAEPIPYAQRPQTFAYVGGVADIRGGREMVRALEQLSDLPAVRLEMAGDVSPKAFADGLRQMAGWSRVIPRGVIGRSEVAGLLGRARAGLVLFHPLPNHVDAQPNKMFEYMSAGLPVIASDFPLWRQIVAGAQCGLLVNPLDPVAIANALRWILQHPDESEVMGRRGRDAVHTKYNWEREAAHLVGLYKKLLPVRYGAA